MAQPQKAPPKGERPGMGKSCGIHGGDEGLVPWSEVAARLESSRNYRVGTTREDGKPHAMPVWGVWADGAVVFGTGRNSRKARNIMRQSEIVAHLESGDDVVIIEGTARVVTEKSEIAAIDALYLKKYAMKLTDAPGELFVCAVEPRVVFAWHEKDYLKSATRFQF